MKDLVVRTRTNKLVTDLVNLDRVRSLLMMISCRRRFLAFRADARRTRMEQGEDWTRDSLINRSHTSPDIPYIVVDSLPVTPPTSSRDITSGQDPQSAVSETLSSPTQRGGLHSPNPSIFEDPSIGLGLRGSRRLSGLSSTDFGLRTS